MFHGSKLNSTADDEDDCDKHEMDEREWVLSSYADPGSGFVDGGGHEHGGGCSFQVWQGDRHVSVD